jgi:hypothetical protein
MSTKGTPDSERPTSLDESSARRIAVGRLHALQERIAAVHLGSKGESAKPEVRARAIQEALEQGFGRWLLATERHGRTLIHVVALPAEKPGWVDLIAVTHNLRSSNTNFVVFAQLSGHATARLMERRRGIDVERLLAEELAGSRLVELIEAGIEKKAEEITFPTTNGAFRFKRGEEGTLVALTWISAGSEG